MTATLLKSEIKQSPVGTLHHGERKLDALTALRFFAASMIFVGHATALAPPNRPNYTDGLALWQGVSFFFVLSGFILAYVYPTIASRAQAGTFLLARFARIWPTHVVAFFATVVLVPECLHIPNVLVAAIMNLCLLQVWTLDPVMAASFNKVSWTISVELFFYLCFPFLIKDFAKPVKFRWIAASALSLTFVLLCLSPLFPGFSKFVFPEAIFVGFNPICRLLEFVLGIAVCRVFVRGSIFTKVKPLAGTALEIGALAAVVASVYLPTLWPIGTTSGASYVIRAWLLDMGGAPAYGALIFLMANERGYISKFLTQKIFVWLGEISFSLYMFHLSIIFGLIKFQPSFANLPDWAFPALAFLICLCVSHLNFKLIETPCRQKIMSMGRRSKDARGTAGAGAGEIETDTAKISAMKLGRHLKPALVIAAEIGFLCLLLVWVNTQYRFVPPALADRVVAHSVPGMRNVEFGDKFKLKGIKITHQQGGIQINAIWQSLQAQKLTYVNALQLLNSKHQIVSSQDYLQDTFERSVASGQVWEDKIFLNRKQLDGSAMLGLELYDPTLKQPLVASNSSTDWDGRRLLIPLN